VKYWEIIADNLKKRGWSYGYVSAVDSKGRTIWIADAHRGDGKRFIVRAENSLFACPHVMSAVRVSSLFQVLHGFRVADSVDRIISIISLSL
jgi:hypothetical protein